jgi:hypothetical protein
MRFPATLAVMALIAVTTASSFAQSPNTNNSAGVPPATRQEIITAVAKADLPALDQLYQQSSDPAVRTLVSMARERIHADFDKSTADAKSCEQSLFDSDPQTALFCARFAVGNLRLAGREQEANQTDLDKLQRFQSKLPAEQVERLRDFATANDHLPTLSVQRPDGSFSIPLLYSEQRERSGSLYEGSKRAIAVVANGHDATMRVSTASEYITLDQDSARELGVHMTDVHVRVNNSLAKNIPAQYGILDKLTFNGVTVENAPVLVVRAPDKVIGIGILKYLGAFRITKDAIEVYGSGDQRPPADYPMLIGSHVDGRDMRLLTTITIDGTPRLALLNTGTPYYLTGDKAALAELDTRFAGQVQTRDLGNVRHDAVIDRTVANVVIGGQSMQMKFAVFADADVPWSYQLGRSALQDMDFYVDFQNRRTALIPRSDLK